MSFLSEKLRLNIKWKWNNGRVSFLFVFGWFDKKGVWLNNYKVRQFRFLVNYFQMRCFKQNNQNNGFITTAYFKWSASKVPGLCVPEFHIRTQAFLRLFSGWFISNKTLQNKYIGLNKKFRWRTKILVLWFFVYYYVLASFAFTLHLIYLEYFLLWNEINLGRIILIY